MTRKGDSAELRELVRQVYGSAARSSGERRSALDRCLAEEGDDASRGGCRDSGLGCGDPVALAELTAGESVLDLGSGMGFDCLAASLEVGRNGRVVGIDVTPEMVRRARRNAIEAGVPTVFFIVADIQSLPLPNDCFDVAISNCVINLCWDKARALAESYRVLRRGGRLAISDVVAIAPLPNRIAGDLSLYAGCVAGAPTLNHLDMVLRQAGFDAIRIEIRKDSRDLIAGWAPGRDLETYIAAADVVAVKS